MGGRGGNPLQNAFEFYYGKNPLVKLRGGLGGLRIFIAYYVELWRNLGLIKRGLKRAHKYQKAARAIVGGGPISIKKLPVQLSVVVQLAFFTNSWVKVYRRGQLSL